MHSGGKRHAKKFKPDGTLGPSRRGLPVTWGCPEPDSAANGGGSPVCGRSLPDRQRLVGTMLSLAMVGDQQPGFGQAVRAGSQLIRVGMELALWSIIQARASLRGTYTGFGCLVAQVG